MREIKFRVWCKNKNEWETDVILLSSNGSIGHFKKGIYVPCKPTTHIIQFYTNLKDKNGIEIYEGDIVQAYLKVYDSENLRKDGAPDVVEYIMPGFYPFNESCHGGELAIDNTVYEIIGNIYENPELLEVK